MSVKVPREESGLEEKIWTRDFTLIFTANFLSFLGFQMLIPTLPLYVRELGGSDWLIGWVVGSFTFSALLIRPYAGHAIDIRGRKPILLAGMGLLVLSVSSFALVGHLFLLLLMRMVQGVGWGLSTTASGTVATDLIPPRRRGEGLGYYGLSINLAMTVGPALGLAIVGWHHFPVLFLLSALLGLGALGLAASIRFQPLPSPSGRIQAASAAATRFAWDIVEKTALVPATLTLFITVTFGGISTFLPIYATEKGIAGIQWYFVLYAITLMVTRPLAGKLYDLKGHRAVFIPGTLLIIIAMLFLAWMNHTWMLLFASMLYGAGFGTIQPAMQAWAVQHAPPERKGMANATFFSSFDLGIGLGAIFFGLIAPIIGYSGIYLIGAGSVVLSILGYLFFTTVNKKKTSGAAF